MNFQQMSENDKTLIDMTVTNTIHIRAIMSYLDEQGVDIQPYIDAELERRNKEIEEMNAKQEELRKQAVEQLKNAAPEEPPPAGADAPLIFGGDVEEEETDEFRKSSLAEDNAASVQSDVG